MNRNERESFSLLMCSCVLAVQALIVSQACQHRFHSGGIRWPCPLCAKDLPCIWKVAHIMINTNCVWDLTAQIKLGWKMRRNNERVTIFPQRMQLQDTGQLREVLWNSKCRVRCFWAQVAQFIRAESCRGLKSFITRYKCCSNKEQIGLISGFHWSSSMKS